MSQRKVSKASDLMTKQVISLSTEDVVTKVHDIFEKNSIHHIPIKDKNGELSGIISRTDFERISAGMSMFKINKKEEYNEALYRSLRTKEIMTPDPECVDQEATLEEIIEVFKGNNFHALPITEGRRVVGIITPYDIIMYYSRNCNCV